MRFTKIKLDTMRFIHNEVNFEAKYEDIENTSDGCKYVGQSGSAAMLAIKRSAGVTPEVNLRNSTQARKHASESTLALEPRADVTRSPKQGYHWPHKKYMCPPKI